MSAGKDILTEAAGSKKGTAEVSVRGGGSKARVTISFRRGSLEGTTWGLTVTKVREHARDLVGDAYTATEAVKRALEGVTVKRNAPVADEVTVNAGRGGVYLSAHVIMELRGEDMDQTDIWNKVQDAMKKDWRFPR